MGERKALARKPRAKKPVGRPTLYSPKMIGEICERLSAGESLKSICKLTRFPSVVTVFRWLEKYEEFRKSYAYAREAQAEYLLDGLIEIADDGTNDYVAMSGDDTAIAAYKANGEQVNRSRLRVDARKWAIAKLAPKKYGDVQVHKHGGDPDGAPIETREVSDDIRAKALLAFLVKTGGKLG